MAEDHERLGLNILLLCCCVVVLLTTPSLVWINIIFQRFFLDLYLFYLARKLRLVLDQTRSKFIKIDNDKDP